MPRVRPLTETDRLNQVFRERLIGLMGSRHISRKKLAELMNVDVNTVYRRVDRPETLRLDEIRRLKEIFPGLIVE